jgi:NDP-sugar pyrophosphorylase family protein
MLRSIVNQFKDNFMQIVIPMSGFGERFRNAGYSVPKPLIVIDGKTIIQHIVEMFPDEDDITFICNKDHLNENKYRMGEILKEIAPECKVIPIEPHKLGPVHAVLQVIDELDLEKPTIVNYADFTCDWNYIDFCNIVQQTKCDGAIPCYRGFHPHTLWSNYYAYVPEKEMRALDIQEKKPFTDSPREEFASSGTYYFKSANLMRQYFERCVSENLTVGGEYYVSMVYKPMIQDGLNIQVYELKHFMQWGTPADLEEYLYWSNIFSSIVNEQKPPKHKGALLFPIAGLGSRFQKEGYEIPKPLINVSGKPMAVQALMDLPLTDTQKFVLREDMHSVNLLKEVLQKKVIAAEFSILDHVTDGQASTCVEGANGLAMNEPVTIAACDNGMIYDSDLFVSLMDSNDVDVIVWAARGYPGAIRNPEMYGWIDADETSLIQNISVKKPLSDPKINPIVVGTFTFKKMSNFLRSVDKMKDRGGRINGEYYVDTAINDAISLGLRCVVFEIDYYICWGTPNDLRTFEYWQSCFNGWKSHPYKLEKDGNISN